MGENGKIEDQQKADQSSEQENESKPESNPVQDKSLVSGNIPISEFNRRIASKTRKIQELEAENERLRIESEGGEYEGVDPKIQQLETEIRLLKQTHINNSILQIENEIKNQYSGKQGRRPYAEVLPELEKIIENDPEQALNLKKLYLDLTEEDHQKYVDSLEKRMNTSQFNRAKESEIDPTKGDSGNSRPADGSSLRDSLKNSAKRRLQALKS